MEVLIKEVGNKIEFKVVLVGLFKNVVGESNFVVNKKELELFFNLE